MRPDNAPQMVAVPPETVCSLQRQSPVAGKKGHEYDWGPRTPLAGCMQRFALAHVSVRVGVAGSAPMQMAHAKWGKKWPPKERLWLVRAGANQTGELLCSVRRPAASQSVLLCCFLLPKMNSSPIINSSQIRRHLARPMLLGCLLLLLLSLLAHSFCRQTASRIY